MRNFKLLSILTLTLFAAIFSSCKENIEVPPSPPSPNYNTEANLDLGNTVQAKFFGRIVDESGNALSGVAITAGNKTATTNSDGVFMIDDAMVYEKLAYVSATKTGYFMGSRSVIPSTTATNNIRITMLDMNTVTSINSGVEETVALPSGAKIDFKGSYVDENGNSYSGLVNVAFKHLPALAEETADQMPGMLYAQNQDQESGALETYGMIAVELTSSTGAELQIDPDSKAVIHMPVDASQLSNAPSTIPLWHFDEVAGYWVEEGEAILTNGEYVGDVTHFSFWNCDRFGDDAQVHGRVEDQDGNPLGNVAVSIITPFASTTGYTNSNGTFFTYVPANAAVSIEVNDDCGNTISSSNVGPYTVNTVNNETFLANLTPSNSVQVNGMFYDCSNNLITNGYVVLSTGSEIYYQNVSNGIINIPILFCNVPTTINVTAYDYDNIQQTNTISVSVSSPATNIGNLIACNSVNEYVTYSIDGGAATTLFPPFNCNETSSVDSITGLTNLGFSFFATDFELLSNSVVLASYPWNYSTGMYIYSNTIGINTQQPVNITFQLLSYGAVGSYVDVNFSGTYEDYSGTNRTISGTIHALRD